MRRHSLIAAILLAAGAAPAAAQGLAPIRDSFVAYGDRFQFRLKARNPYPSAQRFEIALFDEEWRPIGEGASAPGALTLAAGETRVFTVAGEGREIIRVCVRSAPFQTPGGTPIRGEACGKYRILRRSL